MFSRAMQRFISQPSINMVACKRRIADAVIKRDAIICSGEAEKVGARLEGGLPRW
jgi:hypothetical protein